MTDKLSYILIGDPKGKELANKGDNLRLSGLYLWSTAFEHFGKAGAMDTFWRKQDLEEFDMVHINYTPSNLQLPTIIRDELGYGSSTKIIINIDLDVSIMSQNWAYYTHAMIKGLHEADVIFHVEPKGAEILSHLLDRDVKVCPHPVDVSALYDYIKKEREPMAGVMFHRYTPSTLIPYIALRNIPLRRVLFGYQAGKQPTVANAGMYDQIMLYTSFQEHVEEFSKSAVGCDLYQGYSYGRTVVESAGLCVPMVCSSTIAASHLFPETTVHPFDTHGAEEKFKRLVSDDDFADEVIKTAHNACGLYSLKNSYSRFLKMLEE